MGNSPPLALPPGMGAEVTRTALNLCVAAQLATMTSIPGKVTAEYRYEIAPKMQPALDELLYL